MRQRHIGRRTGLHREGDPNDLGNHVIQARCFSIKGKECGALQFRKPLIKNRLIKHRRHLDGVAGPRRFCGQGGIANVLTRAGGCRAISTLQQGIEPGFELQLTEQPDQSLLIGRAGIEIALVQTQIAVRFNRRQLVTQLGVCLRVGELGCQAFGAADRQVGHRFQLIKNGVDATEMLQQRCRGFFADAGDTGNVIDLVAHECQQINNEIGGHAKLFHYAIVVHGRVIHGVDQRHVIIHQLGHIFIARGDHNLTLLGGRLNRQCANDIVGLDTTDADQRQPHGTNGLMDRLDLLAQLVRHRRTICLVLGIHVVAKSGALGVKHHYHLITGIVRDQFSDHANDPLGGARVQAF